MRVASPQMKPFDRGALDAKSGDGSGNPYAEGSVEFGNYELGRAFALRSRPFGSEAAAATTAALATARG